MPEDPYGLSKLLGERLADPFAAMSGASIVTFRFAGINFDPGFASFPERWTSPRGPRGFWTYIDARDAARACRPALEAAPPGQHVLDAAAPTSRMPEPTETLIRQHLPAFRGPARLLRQACVWAVYLRPDGTLRS